MNDVSKRFEQVVKSTYKKFAEKGTILPVKTEQGIQVGDVLIRSEGPYKDIEVEGQILYKSISINTVDIRIANLVAWGKYKKRCEELYRLDTAYNRYFIDSKIFLDMFHRAEASQDWDRAEIMWIRYEDV